MAGLRDRFNDWFRIRIKKGEIGMMQKVVEYLIQNPDVKEKVQEGSASLIGLTELEQQVVLDVFERSGSSSVSPLLFW